MSKGMKTLAQVREEMKALQGQLIEDIGKAANEYIVTFWDKLREVDAAEMPDGVVQRDNLIFKVPVSDVTVGSGGDWPLMFTLIIGRVPTFNDSSEDKE